MDAHMFNNKKWSCNPRCAAGLCQMFGTWQRPVACLCTRMHLDVTGIWYVGPCRNPQHLCTCMRIPRPWADMAQIPNTWQRAVYACVLPVKHCLLRYDVAIPGSSWVLQINFHLGKKTESAVT